MAATLVVLLLLLELICGCSALWRYSSKSPHNHIISTRSAIKLEYEGTLFSEWQVPETCSIQDKRSPKTEMRCSQGVHSIKPIVTGPVVSIWVYDPEYADSDELLWKAKAPSLHSRILTNHFAIVGQKPIIYTTIRRKIYIPDDNLINWTWRVTLPMTGDDVIKNIRGNQVIFQDCFVADFTFLLTFPVWVQPEIPRFLPITSPAGSQLMLSWDACFPSLVVVVADMETFQTNDSFSTWTRVRVPPNTLSDAERRSVAAVLLLHDNIYFLINGVLYLKDTKELTKLGRKKHLPEGEIIGITIYIYIFRYNSQGNIVTKMENNIMFYSKSNIEDALQLHLWTSDTVKSSFCVSASAQVYLVYVFDNGTIQPQEYPLMLELQSVAFKMKEKCPYMMFHDNILDSFYFLDKGDRLTVWAEIIYPENTGLDIIMKVYGPQILEYEESFQHEIALGYCTNTLTMTFYSNVNYEGVDDYFNFEYKNMGNVFVQLRPSQHSNICPVTQKKVRYDWEKYGCPLRLNGHEKFQPLIQLFDDSGHIEDVAVNFILWEIHGRNDYSYNNTMKQSGCLNEAQTWKTMIELNTDLPLEEVWGPEIPKATFQVMQQVDDVTTEGERKNLFILSPKSEVLQAQTRVQGLVRPIVATEIPPEKQPLENYCAS
ncbi:hypothetical protein GW7_16295 [Heterocephalus glaber]|uniref:Cation channel sperm-associated protein subunit epsilon n=1 Tax=Heterocephalus glaber TaxID=10181 RepID=G5AM34_HETGA|nr:hypothetical protein GW7_16295 [Heterocephalus glaber]